MIFVYNKNESVVAFLNLGHKFYQFLHIFVFDEISCIGDELVDVLPDGNEINK